MKVYIKFEDSYYKEPYQGMTSDIKKAFAYDKDRANALIGEQGLDPEEYKLIPVGQNKKILFLGDARHGKDTMAEIFCEKTDYKFASSSLVAAEIFMVKVLKEKYNLSYSSVQEAWNDRVNHRDIWYNEICLYNSEDRLRLVKDILNVADIYVGLRNHLEVEQAIKEDTFDHIIGIYDYRKPREDKSSNTADVFKYSHFVIMNNGTIDNLRYKVVNILLKVIL